MSSKITENKEECKILKIVDSQSLGEKKVRHISDSPCPLVEVDRGE